MNLIDLRDELDLHVRGLEADTSAISTGIAGKVRATKRRRAATGVAALCAVVAIAGTAVSSGLDRAAPPAPAVSRPVATVGADGMPSRVVPDAPGDVVKGGLRYRAMVADDRLAVGFIGDVGQGQATLLWEPTTTHVSINAECYLPGVDDARAKRTQLRLSLGGAEGFFGGQCGSRLPGDRDLPAEGYVPGEPGQGWSELTVGRAASLRVQLVDGTTGKPTQVEGALITAAVYELGAQTSVTDASGRTVAVLPQVSEHQGYRYLLEGVVTRPAAGGPLPEIPTPAGKPFLVTWGSAGEDAGDPHRAVLYLEGLGESSGIEGGGWSTTPQPARAAGTATLRLDGPRPEGGVTFVATYVPAG